MKNAIIAAFYVMDLSALFVALFLLLLLHNNSYCLGVKRFLEVHDFYDIGILSSNAQIYKCALLSNNVFYISVDDVNAKCYRMPFLNCTSTTTTNDDNSNTEDDSEITQYIVVAIIHSENL